ncbi:PucR family transcriptional regulator [Pseudonocardia spinosispora]|uniref:PucR family transcriptional regulator n=1 Tax=Pseudonocardia spinosispora TaxID=103441 RepID=UPI00040106BB|nr:PucR family transcriptional regulator [Pseudonocardia spinosispora]
MSVTVSELLQMPHLRLRLHSGAAGLGRTVSWAHSSDLPDPWDWLAGGELLMTNGLSFPADATGQRWFIERLAEFGVSALAIAEQMSCPELTDALAQTSDRLRLPVLWVEHPMPFMSISRAVAEATLLEQSQRLIRTERIYNVVHRAAGGPIDHAALLASLSRELGCEVQVRSRDTGHPWYPDTPERDTLIAHAVRNRREDAGARTRAGTFVVALQDGREIRLIGVPTQDSAVLVFAADDVLPDPILIQHAATVVGLQLAQSLRAVEHRRRAGAELLAQLLDGELDPAGGDRRLRAEGLAPESSVLVSISGADRPRLQELHLSLWHLGITHITLSRSELTQVLIEDTPEGHEKVRTAAGPGCRTGSSGPLRESHRLPQAAREAGWALRIAESTGIPAARYGQSVPWLGMTSLEEASNLVEMTLRPVLDHDEQHETPLLPTLRTFLEHKRSWQHTASAMHLHRQTVLYRVRKVQALLGRDLTTSRDIAEVWLGLQAFDLLGEQAAGATRSPAAGSTSG